MGIKGNYEVIGGLLQERRETEKEEKQLEEQIETLRSRREALAAENSGQNAEMLQSLDRQIEDLAGELEEQIRKRKDICRIARAVTAGD